MNTCGDLMKNRNNSEKLKAAVTLSLNLWIKYLFM